jgi:hypothetical protein
MDLKTGSREEPIAVVLARCGLRVRLAQAVEQQRAGVVTRQARLTDPARGRLRRAAGRDRLQTRRGVAQPG